MHILLESISLYNQAGYFSVFFAGIFFLSLSYTHTYKYTYTHRSTARGPFVSKAMADQKSAEQGSTSPPAPL